MREALAIIIGLIASSAALACPGDAPAPDWKGDPKDPRGQLLSILPTHNQALTACGQPCVLITNTCLNQGIIVPYQTSDEYTHFTANHPSCVLVDPKGCPVSPADNKPTPGTCVGPWDAAHGGHNGHWSCDGPIIFNLPSSFLGKDGANCQASCVKAGATCCMFHWKTGNCVATKGNPKPEGGCTYCAGNPCTPASTPAPTPKPGP